MKNYKLGVEHDYENFPLIVEVDAESQTDALRKVADRIDSLGIMIGEILKIQFAKE